MYILVRQDLPLPQQIVQAAHAAEEVGIHFSEVTLDPNYIVLCTVNSEAELCHEYERLTAAGVAGRIISEPDLFNQATAMGFEPVSGSRRKHFKSCRLWTGVHSVEGVPT